jgi:hypothetical protein
MGLLIFNYASRLTGANRNKKSCIKQFRYGLLASVKPEAILFFSQLNAWRCRFWYTDRRFIFF